MGFCERYSWASVLQVELADIVLSVYAHECILRRHNKIVGAYVVRGDGQELCDIGPKSRRVLSNHCGILPSRSLVPVQLEISAPKDYALQVNERERPGIDGIVDN